MRGRSVTGPLPRIMKERNVFVEVKRNPWESIFLLMLMCGTEIWTEYGKQSRVHDVSLREACAVSLWDSGNKESINERLGMGACVNGVK